MYQRPALVDAKGSVHLRCVRRARSCTVYIYTLKYVFVILEKLNNKFSVFLILEVFILFYAAGSKHETVQRNFLLCNWKVILI